MMTPEDTYPHRLLTIFFYFNCRIRSCRNCRFDDLSKPTTRNQFANGGSMQSAQVVTLKSGSWPHSILSWLDSIAVRTENVRHGRILQQQAGGHFSARRCR